MLCGNWLLSLFARPNDKDDRSGVPYELAASEMVSRVLYSTRQFSRSRMRPQPGAFDPSPHMELSGIHITGLQEPAIWEVARNTLGTRPGRTTIYARADVLVDALIAQKLQSIRDDCPFVRHTSVKGWPRLADPDQQKERWKAICLALSESRDISLVVPTDPIRADKGNSQET